MGSQLPLSANGARTFESRPDARDRLEQLRADQRAPDFGVDDFQQPTLGGAIAAPQTDGGLIRRGRWRCR
jgi:hypothetical protein